MSFIIKSEQIFESNGAEFEHLTVIMICKCVWSLDHEVSTHIHNVRIDFSSAFFHTFSIVSTDFEVLTSISSDIPCVDPDDVVSLGKFLHPGSFFGKVYSV